MSTHTTNHPGYTPSPAERVWWRAYSHKDSATAYFYLAFSELTALLGILGSVLDLDTRLSTDLDTRPVAGDGSEITGGTITDSAGGTIYIRSMTASEVEAKLNLDQTAVMRADAMRKMVGR